MDEQGLFAASILCGSAKTLASGIVERQLTRDAAAVQDYGRGERDLLPDTEVRLGYLAEALAADRRELFSEQVAWLKVVCAARGVALATLRDNLECTIEELESRLPSQVAARATEILRYGLTRFETAPLELPSRLEDGPHIDLARRFLLAVLETREQDALHLVLDAQATGVSLRELHEDVLHTVQSEVGRMWQMAEITIAEEHYCTDIVTAASNLLRAHAARPPANGLRLIATTVSSETHDVGIRLVAQAFEAAGWDAVFLGASTPATSIIESVRDFGGDLIALSANIVLHVRRTAETIATLRANPQTASLPILVGGQPFNLVDDLWQVVGASGHTRRAWDAPELGTQLTG